MRHMIQSVFSLDVFLCIPYRILLASEIVLTVIILTDTTITKDLIFLADFDYGVKHAPMNPH